MPQLIPSWLDTVKPNFKTLPFKERALCALGALLGLIISSFVSWYVLGGFNAWYIAPMGASSVLLFAVPASPLAQPWNVVIGNTIAGVVGVSCALLISEPTLAFSLAVALTIFLMMSTDSLHPPSGAVAITAVMGGESIHQLGYHFVLYPVFLNSFLLLAVAIIFNQMLGKQYPQNMQIINKRSKDPTPTQKVTIQPQDIKETLAEQTQLLDISEYDLQKIILDAQEKANSRQVGSYLCQDIMTKDVITLNVEESIQHALDKFKQVNLMSLPVVNANHELVGTLALYEVVDWFKGTTNPYNSWEYQVGNIMNHQVVTVIATQDIQVLTPYFVERSFNYIPVVDGKRLIGIISRADMIAAMQQLLSHQS